MICYLGLGSNLGDKRKYLRQAVELIAQIDGVTLLRVSHFYETEPWGVDNQPNYINAAVKAECTLPPLQLLDSLQAIEYKLDRVRNEHWGARTIDIDILSIDGVAMNTERLKLPHPYMLERDFVLVPLSEVSGNKYHIHGDKVIRTTGCLVDFNMKLIACVDRNFGLGSNGNLLFRIAEDMKRFRELTLYHTVIMGRKTFESIGKPLDNRRNIVLSRSIETIDGVEVIDSLDELYKLLAPCSSNLDLVFVIGGGEVYRQLLPHISEIYLTVVNDFRTADTHLTDFSKEFVCDSVNQHKGFSFKHYRRKA